MLAETSNGTAAKLRLSVNFFCILLEVPISFSSCHCGLRQAEEVYLTDLGFVRPAGTNLAIRIS